ncbi:MAG: tRNA uracil 4-sulfurtransferase ThiI [Oscillospiraceae bacterium]
MKQMILAKYGEIALKGLNRNSFEEILLRNIRRRLKRCGKFSYSKAQSTIYIEPADERVDLDEALEELKRIFGIAKLCRAYEVPKDWAGLVPQALTLFSDALGAAKTFKVEAKRADKRYPMTSPQICMELGGALLERFPHLTVDVHNPDLTVTVEIREQNAYLHAVKLDGAGGMPLGSAGQALLLLSGGIDSPVAGFMTAKRGVRVSAIHFESPPYTSERARMKVERLAVKMSAFCGTIEFWCVPFTAIQETLREHCPQELFTILMRRLMMEIAQRIARAQGIQALVTGESIGQVASQTMDAIVCTDAVSTMPVFRPVIAMDKSEIVAISRKIGTFDISIEPYEDCCTVFTPKHPKTRPVLADVEQAQALFDFEPLIEQAVRDTVMRPMSRMAYQPAGAAE